MKLSSYFTSIPTSQLCINFYLHVFKINFVHAQAKCDQLQPRILSSYMHTIVYTYIHAYIHTYTHTTTSLCM